jgi:lysophospholipase L1-like esterase
MAQIDSERVAIDHPIDRQTECEARGGDAGGFSDAMVSQRSVAGGGDLVEPRDFRRNDAGDSGISDREIIQNLSQTIQRLRDRNPNAQIVLQSILPTRSRQIQNDRIAHLNRSLLMMAEGLSVHYLDVHQYFAASDGYLRSDLTTDGIHLSETGYAVWQSALESSEPYLATIQRSEPIATR